MNALIIIDMQEAYFKTPRLQKQKQRLAREINQLVVTSEQNNDLIINVVTIHAADKSTWTLNMLEDDQGFVFSGTKETHNLASLELGSALRIVKTRDSAFHDTDLLAVLRTHDITSLTLAGVSTHSCIFQTASDAYAYNFLVSVVAAATDDEDETAKITALEYLRREYRQRII
jgi:nicotinamidase-related amidase